MSKWVTLKDGEWVVVVPETDILPHGFPDDTQKADLAGANCPCKPKISWDEKMIVHNSFEDIQKIKESIDNNFSNK